MSIFKKDDTGDLVSERLLSYARYILVVVFGLLPLFFVPSPAAPLAFTKVIFVLSGVIAALILLSLSVLRSGKVSFHPSPVLIALWAVVGISLIAALLSGDLSDALTGEQFGIHTAAFVGLLALSASIWTLLGVQKDTVLKLYMLLIVSTIVLAFFHGVRLFFGADTFVFGTFSNSTASPIGGWNDLALYLGLAVLISLLSLGQLKLTRSQRTFFYAVIVIALLMLSVINFYAVWFVLGIVSLGVLAYVLRRDTGQSASETEGPVRSSRDTQKLLSLPPSLLVLAVSLLFIVGGSGLGGIISQYTDISYIEVRPSFQATVDIAREVYKENAFLGIGTNKFADAWRLYKNEAINTTAFWNTDFISGNGYISTFFVTTGVLGGLTWIAFFSLYLYSGIRMLLRTSNSDRGWYFIGVSSFVGASYIWLMSLIYVPGTAILLIASLLTGVTIVAIGASTPGIVRTFYIGKNRRIGFVITLVSIAVIIGSVNVIYIAGKQYSAIFTFNKAVQSIREGADVSSIAENLSRAYETSPQDVFARRLAELERAKINALLVIQDPTDGQRQQFQDALVNGVRAGQLAVETDRTEPANLAVLGDIYSVLVSANIEGAYERALETLSQAMQLDPRNPLRYFALAQLEAQAGNTEAARTYAEKAIALKSDYTNAIHLLTQLDIAAGNTDDAVRRTQSVIALEPNNPARYYQLGVLESSRGNTEAAIAAFEEAVRLDTNYANARYFLALAYDAVGRPLNAKRELERVLRLNPGNQNVIDLINTIDTQGSLQTTAPDQTDVEPVDEEDATIEEDGTVTTTEDPGSSLITPVNTVPSASTEEEQTVDEEDDQRDATEPEPGSVEDTEETTTGESTEPDTD